MIKFCNPTLPDFEDVTRYLQNSFNSGHLSNFGPLYSLFSSELNRYLKLPSNKSIVLTSSGHTALMAAYKILDTKKAIIPAYTFISTYCAASLQGIEIEIADVNINTLTLDENTIKNSSADTVVIVCPLSIIPDLRFFYKICKKYNKKLIVDGAATFGTPNIHKWCDVFCMSFHATKTLSVGEGGAIICNHNYIDCAKSFLNFGMNSKKNIVCTGINGKISEYSCAIALSVLKKIDQVVQYKKDLSKVYLSGLLQFSKKSYFKDTIYQTFPIFTTNNNKILLELEKKGVETKRYYKPFFQQKNANLLYETNLCLPLHTNVTFQDAQNIIDTIKEIA